VAAPSNGARRARFDVGVVQMKPAKGLYAQNLADATDAFAQLVAEGAAPDLAIFPEAAMTGYFLEGAVYDLARPAELFAADLVQAWREAAGERAVDLCCGFYENADGTYYNSAIYLRVRERDHEIVHVHRKMFLATYGVFDEERFLTRGRKLQTFETPFGRAAMLICEDMWHAIMPTIAAVKGARLILVPSASPGRGIEGENELSSITRWRDIMRGAASEHGVYVVYAGLTGFEGGKGFAGSSCVIDPRGEVLVQAPEIDACVVAATLDRREIDLARASLPILGDLGTVLPDLLLDDELPLPKGRTP